VDIDILRKIDRWAGVPLCRLVSLIPGSGAPPQDGFRVRRILVIMLSEMGSLVLAEPMFRELRKKYPEAAVYAVSFKRNRELLDLLGVVPPGNVLAIDDATAGGFLKSTLTSVRAMRRLGIDTAIDGELFTRVSSLLAYLSGARLRVGFHRLTQEGLYRGDFINRPVLYNPYLHFSQQLLTLADAVGSEGRPAGKRVIPPERPTVSPVAFGNRRLRAAETLRISPGSTCGSWSSFSREGGRCPSAPGPSNTTSGSRGASSRRGTAWRSSGRPRTARSRGRSPVRSGTVAAST
jgi:hypothetical protein